MKLKHVCHHPFPISFFAIFSPLVTLDKQISITNSKTSRERFEFVYSVEEYSMGGLPFPIQ